MNNENIEEIERLKVESEKNGAISALADSKGGQIILKKYRSDVLDCINQLCFSEKVLQEYDYITITAKLRERINVLNTFKNAEKDLKLAQQELDKILDQD